MVFTLLPIQWTGSQGEQKGQVAVYGRLSKKPFNVCANKHILQQTTLSAMQIILNSSCTSLRLGRIMQSFVRSLRGKVTVAGFFLENKWHG